MKKWKVTHRDFMKYSAAGVTANALGVLGGGSAWAATADNLEINIAGYAYDRVR